MVYIITEEEGREAARELLRDVGRKIGYTLALSAAVAGIAFLGYRWGHNEGENSAKEPLIQSIDANSDGIPEKLELHGRTYTLEEKAGE